MFDFKATQASGSRLSNLGGDSVNPVLNFIFKKARQSQDSVVIDELVNKASLTVRGAGRREATGRTCPSKFLTHIIKNLEKFNT